MFHYGKSKESIYYNCVSHYHTGDFMKTIYVFAFVLSIIPTILFSQTATPPSAGDGTSGNPYQIAMLENLYWISQSPGTWSSYFIQTANIDASSTSSWDSTGWVPIGTFYGSYDGNGHTVSNLYIYRPSGTYVGLFGILYGGAVVKNIGVTNVNVTGYYYVGGLVGINMGTIENCFASGNVAGSYAWIGGLVGGNDQTGITSGCYSHANATGGDCVGSLAGENYHGGLIQNSYATGNVTGADAGGLSGTNYLGTIINCYSTGSSPSQGLIGFGGGTCTASFWDTTTSGCLSSGGGYGRSTAEMKMQSTYTDSGWDFTTIWEITGANYPHLRANPDSSLSVGVNNGPSAPVQFVLNQNYPNPFNPTTTIAISLAKSGHISLKIFDVMGREVATLVDGFRSAGNYNVHWDASTVPSGIYFCRLTTDAFSSTRKMILMK
jgi:hypothetical protein